MGNANFIELETCLSECIEFCSANSDHEFVDIHSARLDDAKRKFEDGISQSDARFITWLNESRDEKLRWKKVGDELANVQKQLRRVNAVDFPTEVVRHWDIELLQNAVDEMVHYLEQKSDSIESASALKDGLTRVTATAQSESKQCALALDEYRRFARLRAEAFGTLSNVLGDFRKSMRRNLGKRDELYQSIRWPMSLEPDETVL